MKGLFFTVLLTVLDWTARRFFNIAKVPEFFGKKTFALMYWISRTFLTSSDEEA